MNKIENTPTFIAPCKNIWSYTKMDILFKEISKYWISKEDFIDRFLEIYEEIESRYSEVFLRNWYREVESFFDKFVSLATQKIIEIEKDKENDLNFSIFVPKEPSLNLLKKRKEPNNKSEAPKEVKKYETLLKVLHKKYWLNLEWVEINTYVENFKKNSFRKFPYKIITLKTENTSLTIAINNQIWEGTYVYYWIIEPSVLSNVSKWDKINDKSPVFIKYSDKFKENLEVLLSDDFLRKWSDSLDYKNPEHLKILLSSITDKYWNELKIDLRTVWIEAFIDWYFWHMTVFQKVTWRMILKNGLWIINKISLKKILEYIWVLRPDLPSKELDYKNSKHIETLLSSITDKDWNKIDVDLNTILLIKFSKLNFWYWTEFWVVKWSTILINNWLNNIKTLKKVLGLVWIKRLDLGIKNVDCKNLEHIKILLSSITDGYWNKVEVDLKTIWVLYFSKLNFWYWTEFWMIKWSTILERNWWRDNKTLMKILWYYWIKRLDLGIKNVDCKNLEHIKILLSSITDGYWNKVEVDLKTIWVRDFSKLNFWYWTEFWIVKWWKILSKNSWLKIETLENILTSAWISRNYWNFEDPNHIKLLLSNITDKDWNNLEIDLKTIWVVDFSKLHFWYWTEFWKVTWTIILNNNGGANSISLKKILGFWLISRLDLPDKELDYRNPEHLKILLSSITDKYWNGVEVDLRTVWVIYFSKLHFWYWTEFWIVSWSSILRNNWNLSKSSLRKVLKNVLIIKDDLDLENSEHIKILLSSITDKHWNKVKTDLKTIWLINFSELHFWYWTEFWNVRWSLILNKNGGINNISLKKILENGGISRSDLPSKKIDYKNFEHIKILLSSITDEHWNKMELDLKTVWIWYFTKLYFWYWTEFWNITWGAILNKGLWVNGISFKNFLENIWISRPDLPSKELDYRNPEHIKIVLSSITDKDWNKVEIDLKTIWVRDFSELHFWYWTEFWIVKWRNILFNNLWLNIKSLENILTSAWISRNYWNFEDPNHIKLLLSNIIDKNWNKVELDLKTILVGDFIELYYWSWTEFWIVRWSIILKNNLWINRISLKKILEDIWISRPDLPSKELDYRNPEHIKIVLSSITDKDWNKVEIDLKTIWMRDFSKLDFWYWTEFWKVTWFTILDRNLWVNCISLKNILESIWIPRLDLPSKDLDYGNLEHIKILLSSITDKYWKKAEEDLKTIKSTRFSELYFWYWTEFWSIKWVTIIKNSLWINNWWIKKVYLKRILESIWISRPDL